MNTLAARVNIATNHENFYKVLEKYNIDIFDFLYEIDKVKAAAELPEEYNEAIQAGIDQYMNEVY